MAPTSTCLLYVTKLHEHRARLHGWTYGPDVVLVQRSIGTLLNNLSPRVIKWTEGEHVRALLTARPMKM